MSRSIQTYDDNFVGKFTDEEDDDIDNDLEEEAYVNLFGESEDEEEEEERRPKSKGKSKKRGRKKMDYRDVQEEEREQFVYTELPSTEERRLTKETTYYNEGVQRLDYVCELCRLGNLSSDQRLTKGVTKMYETYEQNYKKRGDVILYSKLAEIWNEKVYKPNLILDQGNSLKIQKLSPATVQYHFEKCMISDVRQTIYDDIEYFNECTALLRLSGVHIKSVQSGTIQTNTPGMRMYLSLHKAKLNAYDFMQKYECREAEIRNKRQKIKY